MSLQSSGRGGEEVTAHIVVDADGRYSRVAQWVEAPRYREVPAMRPFRKPHGRGWALTSDAAYLKDPSTGFGIHDAFAQAFPLAEAIGSALDGADWESTMVEYQRVRDEALTPLYEGTLAFTRQEAITPDAQAWLRAICGNIGLSRTLALNISIAARAAGVFAPPQLSMIEAIAETLHPAPREPLDVAA